MNLATEFHPVPKPTKAIKERTSHMRRTGIRVRSRKKTSYTPELRHYIRRRDNNRCQSCGGVGVEIHHVIPKGRFYPKWYTFDDVHDERNLMLLCWKCHREATDNNDKLERLIALQEKRFGPLRKRF